MAEEEIYTFPDTDGVQKFQYINNTQLFGNKISFNAYYKDGETIHYRAFQFEPETMNGTTVIDDHTISYLMNATNQLNNWFFINQSDINGVSIFAFQYDGISLTPYDLNDSDYYYLENPNIQISGDNLFVIDKGKLYYFDPDSTKLIEYGMSYNFIRQVDKIV